MQIKGGDGRVGYVRINIVIKEETTNRESGLWFLHKFTLKSQVIDKQGWDTNRILRR